MRNGIVMTALVLLTAPAFAGRGGSVQGIESAIASGSPESIIGEIERAEKLVCMSCVRPVLALVDHSDPRVRDVAGWWLSKRGVRDEVIANMTARLQAQDPIAARNAADVLGGMREGSAVPVLGAYLAKPLDEESAIAVTKALGKIGSPAGLGYLKTGTQSSIANIRAASLKAMRLLRSPMGAKAPFTVDAILPLLADSDPGVRREAAYTAGWLADKSAVSTLVTMVGSDSSAQVKKAAAWALGEIGDAGATAALNTALNDADPTVRSIAAGALTRLK